MSQYDDPLPVWQSAERPGQFGTGPRPRTVLLWLLLIGLCVAALVLLTNLPSGHGPRIVGVLLPVGLGLLMAITVARRWGVRLGCVVGGLMLAAVAWWFVPTTAGLSLWSAHRLADRLVTELNELRPADFNGYLKNQDVSHDLVRLFPVRLFPAFQGPLYEARADWSRRTAGHLVKELEDLPAGAMDAYRQGSEARQQLGNLVAQHWAQVQQAEQNWAARTADQQVAELQALRPGDLAGLKAGQAARAQLAELFPEHRTRLQGAEHGGRSRSCEGPGRAASGCSGTGSGLRPRAASGRQVRGVR
jgi:hypothetical protein